MNAETLIRENVRGMAAYEPPCRDGAEACALLDANENPFPSAYNRYPDAGQRELKEAVGRVKGVDPLLLTLGNGSDELIDLLVRAVCVPGRDNVVVFPPTYGMYEFYARLNDAETRRGRVDGDFLPVWEELPGLVDGRTKAVFLCTPGNPVGNMIPLEAIRRLAGWFPGLVVVDEAYIDFADGPSAAGLVEECGNVVVLQTLSKAWGAAGLRVGICVAAPALTGWLNRMRAPYNIGSATQRAAAELLGDGERFRREVAAIRRERERMKRELRGMRGVEVVGDSQANFVLARVAGHERVADYLRRRGVMVRVRHEPPLLAGCLRLTVGTREENDLLYELLNECL